MSIQQATLLYEDQDFYEHIGVDFIALINAFYTSYIKRSHRVGASTITMQVARLHFGMNTHVIFGKVEQIKKFELLADEWTIESGEMTPTMKVKRKVIKEKYKTLIEDIYNV